VIDRYDSAYNIQPTIRNEMKHHPVHWKKSSDNSLLVPPGFIRDYSKELLGVDQSDLDLA
jgi:hypothetical protein